MYGGLHSLQPPSPDDLLAGIAWEFTPRIEILNPGLVLLDLYGTARLWPSPQALGAALVAAAQRTQLDVQAALASTRAAALLVARARSGLTVVPAGGEAEALAPLPLTLLDSAREHLDLFRRWGLITLGDLARLPPNGLAARLGPEGARLRRLARGEDDRPFQPTPPPETFDIDQDLEWPPEGLEPLAYLLEPLLDRLCSRLQGRGRTAAAIHLTFRLGDGTRHERRVAAAVPTAEPRTWKTLLLLDVESHPPGDAICGIGLCAEPTPVRAVQLSLIEPARLAPERLVETLGRLHEWIATGRAGRPILLDSHRPDALAMGSFEPAPRRRSQSRRHPSLRVTMRVFRPARRARVAVDAEGPTFVVADDVRGAVVDRSGPWRASGDWWGTVWSREEWDVALASGALYRLYRDRLKKEWFVAGELD
jgi:protein ImuB